MSRRIFVFLLAALILVALAAASALALPPQAANSCKGIAATSKASQTPAGTKNPLFTTKVCEGVKA